MIWPSRIMFDISGALSLRGGEAAEVGTGDTVETRSVLLDDILHPDTVAHDVERLLTDLDGCGHRPGILDQRRQSQRRNDEADLVEALQPPRLHDKTKALDTLVKTELLRRRHQLQVERAVATLARHEEARPLPDQRIDGAAPHRGEVGEDLAHHRRLGGRIQAVAAEHAAVFESQQVDRVLIVVDVDLAAVWLAQRLPFPLLDENLVTHPEMLLDDVFVEMPVNGRNDMNHEFPHGLKWGQPQRKRPNRLLGNFP